MTALAATAMIFSPGAASAADPPVGDGKYHAISNVSGLVLEREGRCANPTGYAIIDADSQVNAQLFRFDLNAEGTVYIYDRCGALRSRALTAPSQAGGRVGMQAYESTRADQKWNVTKDSSGRLTITSVAGGYALDTDGTAALSEVVANTPDPQSSTQRWAVVSTVP
ncbi:RICIN domain-containing protein [Streptomyces sp. NPDC046261]|uniref:RICIN domain-containing protein n=1 Tax=Streptomyces sp. NPDC046261 TaxID=3157200 RepID=UPI0033E7BCDD